MSKTDIVLLNLTALDNRLRELGLKRTWVADQIGVDRRTMTRWLNGYTRRISFDNLRSLAQVLACKETDLTLASAAGVYASDEDRGLAARLVEQENLLEILTPSGKWPLLEELVRAVMRPDLPRALLGQLYNYLAIACWRQSHLDKAEAYTALALAIGEETGHRAVLARAKLNEATVQSFRGRVKDSIAGYLYCVEQNKYLEDEQVRASALSNLGMVYWEYGDFAASLRYQDQAVAAFAALKKDVNLAIAWIGRATTLVDMGQLDAAMADVAKAVAACERGGWRRGSGDAALVATRIAVARGEFAAARAHWKHAAALFADMGIDESRTVTVEASVLRIEGAYDRAHAALAKAMSMHPDFPVGKTETLREYLELAHAEGDAVFAAVKRAELRALYEQCGCDGWLAHLGVSETS